MVKDRLTIFISGKEGELDDERAISNELAEYLQFNVKSSEKRIASSESMSHENENEVLNSDIYLGLFGQIYSEPSIREYEKASNNNIPQLIFVKQMKEGIDRDPELKKFIQNIRDSTKGVVTMEYVNAVDLKNKIFDTLMVLFARKFSENFELKREVNTWRSKSETHDVPSTSDIVKKLEYLWGVRYDKDFGRARIIQFDIPEKLESDKKYSTLAKIKGHVKNGFLDLALIDPDDKPPYSWFPDPKSYVRGKDNGNLFIGSGEYENKWEFTIGHKKGKYKAIMGIFENNYDQRVCIDYVIKEIMVT